jgi:uncharacterized membrane protein HdeD (DUF308 family)
MAGPVESPQANAPQTFAQQLRSVWGLLLILGALLVILGLVALAHAFLATVVSMLFLGWLLIFGGILQLLHAFFYRNWRGAILSILGGFLQAMVGLMFVRRPIEGSIVLTLFLAAFLMVEGAFRAVTAVMYRFESWGWQVVAGVLVFLLGAYLWIDLPEAGLVLPGIFLGVQMLFNGMSMVMLALAVRTTPPPAAPAP